MKNGQNALLTKRSHVLWLTAAIGILFFAGGYFFFRASYANEIRRAGSVMEGIARLKANQISQWRTERFADGRVLANSPVFSDAVEEFIRTGSPKLRNDILERLKVPLREYSYADILLTDPLGNVFISAAGKYTALDKAARTAVRGAAAKRTQTSTGLVRHNTNGSEIHYEVISPVLNRARVPIATLLIHSDPATLLYPLIQQWPVESRTSESVLIRKDGDSVLYLNELRHQKNTALRLRIPLTRTDLPAVQAALGKTGVFEGKDYRGHDVLAFLLPVPGSDWFIVAKMDREEVLAGFYGDMSRVVFILFLLFAAMSFGSYGIYIRRQRNHLRDLFAAEKKLREAEGELEITLRSIGDAVISTDRAGKVRFMNPVAEELTGWKFAEAKGKALEEVFVIINEDSRSTVESPVAKVLREGVIVGLANHTLLIAKDGRETPIADSGAPVRDADDSISGVVLVFRDQAEERFAKKLIEARVAILEYAAAYPLNEMLAKGLDEVERLTGSAVSFFHFVEPDGKTISLHSWSTATSRDFCSIDSFERHYPLDAVGVWADCVRERKTIIHNDYDSLPNKKGMPEGHTKLTRELVAPVFKSGNIVAILGTGNKKEDYTERDSIIVSYLAGVMWEAVEWKKAETEKLFLANTVEISANEIYIFDEETLTFSYVNDGARNNLGYSMEELRRLTPLDLKPDFTRQQFAALIAPLKDGTKPQAVFETRHRRKDGSLYPVEVRLQLIRQEHRSVFLAIILDTTERIEAEKEKEAALSALKESEENYRHLFEAESDAILLIDNSTGEILRANEAAAAMYGYSKAEMTALKNTDLSAEPEQTAHVTQTNPVLEDRVVTIPLRWHKKRDGTLFPVEITGRFFMHKEHSVHIAAIRDITLRLKTEEALRESEHRFRLLFNEMESGFALHEIVFDDNGAAVDYRFLLLNPAFEKLTGLSAPDVTGKTVREIFPGIDERWIERYARVAVSGTPERFEDYFSNLDRHYEIRAYSPEKNKFAVLFTDVTPRVKALKNLDASEKKYRYIFDTTNEGLCATDAEDTIILANPQMSVLLGYSVDELHGMHYSALLPEESIAAYALQTEKRKKGLPGIYEQKLRKKNGGGIWMRISATPTYNDDGTFSGSYGMFTDITARIRAEEQVRKLQRGLEQSPVSVVITNRDGVIEYVNAKFCEVTGYSSKEVLGQTPRVLKSGEKPGEEYKALWDTILAGDEWAGEFHNRKKNGELFWEAATIAPVKDELGEITHFIAVKEDITEKKKMIGELIEAKEKAEEMNRVKSNFFAQMSHELRTPLIGILGYSEVFEDRFAADPDLHKMAHTIHTSGNRLLNTLNLILELSKADSHKTPVLIQETNILPLLREARDLYSSIAAARNIKLHLNAKDESVICPIDRNLFANIFNNLINNAVKYTDAGSVTIQVLREPHRAVIRVADTGIGIPVEMQEVIWEEFRQASEGLSRSFEGTGLGLSIAKKYTELMNGTISVHSRPGAGSTFVVTLPVSETNILAPSASEPSEQDFYIPKTGEPKYNILYVEDDEVVAEIVKDVGRGLFNIEVATDAVTAYEKVSARQYDAILMDINLRRGMDGVQLTQIIRVLHGYQTIPIIAITAYAMDGDKEEFLSKGMTHYISKPFRRKDLYDILCKALSAERT